MNGRLLLLAKDEALCSIFERESEILKKIIIDSLPRLCPDTRVFFCHEGYACRHVSLNMTQVHIVLNVKFVIIGEKRNVTIDVIKHNQVIIRHRV